MRSTSRTTKTITSGIISQCSSMLTSVRPTMAPRITLAEVRGIGGLERELVAEGNDCIDHAQRDTAVNELKQDFHIFNSAKMV
jgi:hypothetical protein